MNRRIRSSHNLTCHECKLEATPEEMLEDRIRMYEAGSDKILLCECCMEEYKERWEEFD